jgi:PAS domain S-box-containing protein
MPKKRVTPNKSGNPGQRDNEAPGHAEEKFRILVETAGAGIAIFDIEANLTFVNDRLCRLAGYSKEELEGHAFAGFMHKEDLPYLMEAFHDAVSGNSRSGMLEFRLVCKDGQSIWVHGNPEPVVIDGKMTGFSAIIYDITDRKQLEGELRESEERFSAVFNINPDPVAVSMSDTARRIMVNPAFVEWSGYPHAELIGSTVEQLLVHPEDRDRILTQFRRNNELSDLEIQLHRKNGEIRDTLFSVRFIEIGGRKYLFSRIHDITERKLLEKDLRESEERFRRLSENAIDVIYRYRLKPDAGFEYVSPATVKLTGYAPEEYYADPLLARKIVHPEDRDQYRQHFSSPELLGAPLALRWIHKDGHITWAEEIDVPVYNLNGEIIAYEGIVRDITGRRQAEGALRESEERYRSIMEQMQDSYYEVDLAGNYTFVNESAGHSFGYSRDEMLGLNYRLTVPEEDIKGIFAAYNEVYRTAKPNKGFPHRIRHKDGSITFSEMSIDVNRNTQGEIIGFKSVSRDITERKLMEEAVRRSSMQFQSIIEHITDIFYMLNSDYEMLYISPQAEQVLGYTTEEVRNNWRGYVTDNPINLAAHEKTQLAITTGEKQEPYLQEFMHRDGKKLLIEINESPLKNDKGEVIGMVGAARDVTERKRIESALRESEEKYRMVVENSLESIYIAVDGILQFSNKRAAELSGYSQEELISRPFIEFIHPDDRQMVVERYLQRLKGMDVPGIYSFRIIDKAGNIRWVELSAVFITWEGRPATLNFLTDVTDRRRLEEERQRVAKLESVGLLAAGIAHDFNNILTAILGNISLAGTEAEPGSELRNSLEQAEKASQRARDLTQQLLTFSKGGAPVLKLASLTQLLRDTASFALSGSNVKCRFSIPDGLWQAEIDEGQVSQVIHNLVINAQQAMPAGGSIDLLAENMALSKKQRLGKGLPLKEGNYIRVTVADHGSGIPAEHLDKIFDPFFTTKKVGSGLGLATSFSIARNHGGHLSVESAPGAGSTFYLYLPASQQTSITKREKKETIKPAGKARILVMDDEQGVREIAGRMLTHLGYADIEFAVDGAEAIKLYKAAMKSGKPFTVAILDLTIAGGMGGEVAIQKLLKIDPGVKAIVSSGYADDLVIARYEDYGFSGMVAKPYTLEQLRKAVHDVIG